MRKKNRSRVAVAVGSCGANWNNEDKQYRRSVPNRYQVRMEMVRRQVSATSRWASGPHSLPIRWHRGRTAKIAARRAGHDAKRKEKARLEDAENQFGNKGTVSITCASWCLVRLAQDAAQRTRPQRDTNGLWRRCAMRTTVCAHTSSCVLKTTHNGTSAEHTSSAPSVQKVGRNPLTCRRVIQCGFTTEAKVQGNGATRWAS